MKHRIGIGFDSHALVAGRACLLGGVRIPHPAGPLGHSDGDAVLHAIADALLGAAGLEDLGTLFPDRDPRWKDADSALLLREVAAKVRAAGFQVVNVDVVVATEGPRIAPHREAIRARIGEILGIDRRAVGIKGKSLEGLPLARLAASAGGAGAGKASHPGGAAGGAHGDRSDGAGAFVAVQAVCLLEGE